MTDRRNRFAFSRVTASLTRSQHFEGSAELYLGPLGGSRSTGAGLIWIRPGPVRRGLKSCR